MAKWYDKFEGEVLERDYSEEARKRSKRKSRERVWDQLEDY